MGRPRGDIIKIAGRRDDTTPTLHSYLDDTDGGFDPFTPPAVGIPV